MAKLNPKEKHVLTNSLLLYIQQGSIARKITGKLYYFGSDKRKVLERYVEQVISAGGIGCEFGMDSVV